MWIYSQSIFSNNHEFLRPAIELQINKKSPSFNPYACAGFQKTPKHRDLETDPLWHHTGHIYIRHLPVRSVTTPLARGFSCPLKPPCSHLPSSNYWRRWKPSVIIGSCKQRAKYTDFLEIKKKQLTGHSCNEKREFKNSYIIIFRNTKLTNSWLISIAW